MKKLFLVPLATLATAVLFAGPASAQSVQQQIDALDQKQKIIDRKLELADEASKDKGSVTLGKEGFILKSGDGKYKLAFKGLIHADARTFLNNEAGYKGTNTFVARRVRPYIEGSLGSLVDFRIMSDFGNGATALQDAYFDLKFLPQAKVRVGKFKSPVGLERLQQITALNFIDLGLPTALVPNRDIGIQVSGDIWDTLFHYDLGLFNGSADGASADLDINDNKEIAARVFSHPFSKSKIDFLSGLGVGVGFSYGQPKGFPESTGLASYKSNGQQTIFSYRSSTAPVTGTVVANGQTIRVAPQLYYYWGPFGLLGEFTISKQNVRLPSTGATASLTHKAYQAETTFALTGEKASYKGLKPKKSFDLKKHQFGAVELAARYGGIDFDDNSFPVFSNPATAVSKAQAVGGGVNWYLTDNVKIATDYEQTFYKGGKAVGNRPTEKVLQSRLQLAF